MVQLGTPGESVGVEMVRVLSHGEARSVYDRIGSLQDTQSLFEDKSTGDLVAHGDFQSAHSILEFGCGTGRFAKGLLEQHLSPTATYLGVDLSPEMVDLARARLERFGQRTEVRLSDGDPRIDVPDASCDRFVSTFVFDLLSEEEVAAVVREARRILTPDGLLCLASLTFGFTRLSRLFEGVWNRLYAYRPSLVGGCRPIDLRELVPETAWEVRYRHQWVSFGMPSEVLVAAPR